MTDLKVLEGYSWEYLLEEAKKNPDWLKVALSQFQYLKDFAVTRDKAGTLRSGAKSFHRSEPSGVEVVF